MKIDRIGSRSDHKNRTGLLSDVALQIEQSTDLNGKPFAHRLEVCSGAVVDHIEIDFDREAMLQIIGW